MPQGKFEENSSLSCRTEITAKRNENGGQNSVCESKFGWILIEIKHFTGNFEWHHVDRYCINLFTQKCLLKA